jgi:hypothetical protein
MSELNPAPQPGRDGPDSAPVAFPRAQGETARAYQAFMAYFQLGQLRTLPAVADKLGENLGTVKNWSSKYDWADRLHAFNSGLIEQQATQQSAASIELAADWGRRLAELRELEWDVAQKLAAAARCFLDNYGDSELSRMSLSEVSRALAISSRIARAALAGADQPAADASESPLQLQLLNAVNCLYRHQPDKPAAPASAAGSSSANPQPASC